MTDHQPLLTILGPKAAIPPLAAAHMKHWAIVLSAYDSGALQSTVTVMHSPDYPMRILRKAVRVKSTVYVLLIRIFL